MIKAVQKNLCELPKANDVAPSKSDDLTLNNGDINTTDDDETDDCIYVSPDESENAPIIIDSDTDGGRNTNVARTKKKTNLVERAKVVPVRRKLMCFCTSIYCRNCLNENARKKLFQMYMCHPIITTHVKMCETVALLINLPQDKVRRLFSRLQNYLILGNEDPTVLQLNKALKGYEGNFPRNLAPLELCQIKRKLLNSKPVWFNKTFSTCCRIFRYKISTPKLINLLNETGKLKFRRITNRISKKSKLVAIEEKENRLERISYIRRIQKYRKENQRIIYINAMMIGDKMIVIAAGFDGPITSAFITSTNASGFLKWLSKDIVGNLKEKCVFVLGPSCKFRCEKSVPQQTDSKDTIITWLENEKIPYTSDMYKTELYDLILQNTNNFQPAETGCIITEYLAKINHIALHIPDANRDLDPFEYIWFQIKLRMIANGTASFNINGQLTSLPRDIWIEQFERVYSIENVYLQIECNMDRTFRRFRVDNDDFKSSEILYAIDHVSC
ncbi:uncharacterized protein LOC116341415 [Contarinia nasturtii]|uniref:uncharacterized protein LOC116341415 n=1 Tax=Contarinia nasturtii TaxID=265458 RepID=UPI0012D4554C|nr:uncharacterized protein LOC116341415 [Contarinia nasturtii]